MIKLEIWIAFLSSKSANAINTKIMKINKKEKLIRSHDGDFNLKENCMIKWLNLRRHCMRHFKICRMNEFQNKQKQKEVTQMREDFTINKWMKKFEKSESTRNPQGIHKDCT